MIEDGGAIPPNKQELEERRGRKNLDLEEKEKRERGRLNDHNHHHPHHHDDHHDDHDNPHHHHRNYLHHHHDHHHHCNHRHHGRLNDIERRKRSRERKQKLKSWSNQGNRKQLFESDSDSETENTAAAKGKTGKVEELKKEEERAKRKDIPEELAGEMQVLGGSPVQVTRKFARDTNLGGFPLQKTRETPLQETRETQVIAGSPAVQVPRRENIPDSILPTQYPSTQEFHLALKVCCCICLISSKVVCLVAFSFSSSLK